jgi:hypothetical protein
VTRWTRIGGLATLAAAATAATSPAATQGRGVPCTVAQVRGDPGVAGRHKRRRPSGRPVGLRGRVTKARLPRARSDRGRSTDSAIWLWSQISIGVDARRTTELDGLAGTDPGLSIRSSWP